MLNSIVDFFKELFDTQGFPPRWACGSRWTFELGTLHIVSDVIIFFSYISIPILLAIFISKRKDTPFIPIFWLFAGFITFCGLSHLLDASLFWHPWYRLFGLVKGITAVISLITVIALSRVIPKALQIPGMASARAHYEFIVESTSDAIITCDNEGICQSWNHGAEKMFGYKIEETLGRNLNFLIPQSDKYLKESRQNNQAILQGQAVNLYEAERIHKSGKFIKVIATYSKLMNSQNEVIGICTITKDLTSKKDLEDQLAIKAELLADKAQLLSQQNKKLNILIKDLKIKNEETNSFAYAASHDLKSPLRIITNFSHLIYEMAKEKLDDDTLNLIKTIQSQALQMGGFINDLSAYLQLGSEDYAYQSVDCKQMIDDIVQALNIPETFHINVDIRLQPLYAPRIPLQIVLQNLIINAVIHHDQLNLGQVKITAEQIHDKVIFRVKDNGAGIPEAYHEKIFDVFQTLKPREETGGSGIGLSLVRRVLQRYGGTIKLYSKEGEGTTFEVVWLVAPKSTTS